MKIAIFHNLNSGGSKRALDYQLHFLEQFGHRIKIYTLPVPIFNSIWNYLLYIYLKLPFLHKAIAEKIESWKPDIVFVAPDHLTQSPYLLRYLQTPSVYYCPEPKRDLYESAGFEASSLKEHMAKIMHFPLKWIDHVNANSADRILTNSNYSKKVLQQIYRRKIYVNYLGVDTKWFYRKKNTNKHKKFTILSVGTFLPHKGFDFLIKSAGFLQKEKNNIRLILVGNGGSNKLIKDLKALAKKERLEIEIFINVSSRKLRSLYQNSSVFAAPFHHEPFGLVILEALSCGLPVIAVNEGGVSEIKSISPSLPIVLLERDIHQFSRGLGNKHKNSPNSQKILSKKWGWENSVRQLEKHLIRTQKHTRYN
jgi:glycosyltransferase involved in cell wall biosynthesis